MATRNITSPHCQSCGSTSAEDIGHEALRRGDGYTACCNERVVYADEVEYGYLGRAIPKNVKCADREDCYHD